MPAPLLTHVLVGRNDNYLGNFKHRLEMMVNYFCTQVEATGHLDDYELLIVDWNSDSPLREALNLNSSARACTFFLEVPPEMVARHNPIWPVVDRTIPLNIATHHASAEMIMFTPADVLFPFQSVRSLFDLLAGKIAFPVDIQNCFLGIDRFEIPWQAAERLCEEDIDRYITLHSAGLTIEGGELRKNGLSWGEGANILSKKMLIKLNGFNETFFPGFGPETELALRVNQVAPYAKAGIAGVYCYDLYPKPKRRQADRLRNWPTGEPFLAIDPVVNNDDWGLQVESIVKEAALYCPEVNNRPQNALQPYSFFPAYRSKKKLTPIFRHVEFFLSWLLFGSPLQRYALNFLLRLCASGVSDGGCRKHTVLLRHLLFQSMIYRWLAATEETPEFFISSWFGDTKQLQEYLDAVLDARMYCLTTSWTLHDIGGFLAVLAVVGKEMPRRFLFCPARDLYIGQAAALNPSIEITCYDDWHDRNPCDVSWALIGQGFKGYLHILSGAVETAFTRLKKIQFAGDPFQCIFLNLDYLQAIFSSLLDQVTPLMDTSCTIICRGDASTLRKFSKKINTLGFLMVARLPGVIVFTRSASPTR